MALLSGTTGAASALASSGALPKIGDVTLGAADKVKDVATGAVDSIGGTLGIGPGNEAVKQVPDGVPQTPQQGGPRAGTAYKNGTGDGVPFDGPTLALRPGLYNYDDLNSVGMHDALSGLKVREGFEVFVYKGVENGKPAGERQKITGPASIPEMRGSRKLDGFENTISAIAVREKPGAGAGGLFGSGQQAQQSGQQSGQQQSGGIGTTTVAGGVSIASIALALVGAFALYSLN